MIRLLLLGCAALIALVTSAAVRDDKITKSEVDVRREYILTAKKPGESLCYYNGKSLGGGEEIQVEFLRLKCVNSAIQVVGCVFRDENGVPIKLEKGDRKEVGRETHYCVEKHGSLQYYAKSAEPRFGKLNLPARVDGQKKNFRLQLDKNQPPMA
ncbi:hypothetical protein AAVH_17501 [Aphelenchoides avenae]|nr:hypothetical protein AAVH_17501 [Aphelenchus avenae]